MSMNDGIRISLWRGYLYEAKRGTCSGFGETEGLARQRLGISERNLFRNIFLQERPPRYQWKGRDVWRESQEITTAPQSELGSKLSNALAEIQV